MANLIYDSFVIKEKYHANSEDSNNLTKLYLPIMGIDAFSLYNVLTTLDEDEEYTYKNVLDLLAKFNLTTLNQSLDKLEALGLVKTFYNKDKGFLHEVYPPLSRNDFLSNELLRELLVGSIGEDSVKKFEKKKDYKGFKDITKKFSDVFTVSTSSNPKTIYNMFKPGISVENKDFNYCLFMNLCEDVVPNEVLNDTKFEGHIMRIAFTYKLTPEEMHECILKTLEIDKNFEYASIAKNARSMFGKKFKGESPHIATIKNDEYLDSIQDDEWKSLLSEVEGMSFTDILYNLSGMKPALAEIKMFEKLQEETGYSCGVINLMILMVNTEKDGALPGYNYFEKIAQNWKRAKINNAYDVLKYYSLKKQKEEKAPTNKQYDKKTVSVPSWYKEYHEQLEKTTDNKELSDDAKKETLSFIKELFND